MPARCTPCLNPKAKDLLAEAFPEMKPRIMDVADCPEAMLMNLCGEDARQERPRSAYQEFISVCMKEKHIKSFSQAPPAMKACAAEWREKKRTGSAKGR